MKALPSTFAFSTIRNFNEHESYTGLCELNYQYAFWKLNSYHTPKRVTSSLNWTQVKSIFESENQNWNFPGLAIHDFNLNHFNMFFIVHIKSCLILGRSFHHEYIVLSSAKLQIPDFFMKKKI